MLMLFKVGRLLFRNISCQNPFIHLPTLQDQFHTSHSLSQEARVSNGVWLETHVSDFAF